uniref:Uncharacterized protein n=1 Tax=Anopheles atroparvus TaxID=41427 RepID=A0A182IQ17_ANOAO
MLEIRYNSESSRFVPQQMRSDYRHQQHGEVLALVTESHVPRVLRIAGLGALTLGEGKTDALVAKSVTHWERGARGESKPAKGRIVLMMRLLALLVLLALAHVGGTDRKIRALRGTSWLQVFPIDGTARQNCYYLSLIPPLRYKLLLHNATRAFFFRDACAQLVRTELNTQAGDEQGLEKGSQKGP